jgi:hypothetical protein
LFCTNCSIPSAKLCDPRDDCGNVVTDVLSMVRQRLGFLISEMGQHAEASRLLPFGSIRYVLN